MALTKYTGVVNGDKLSPLLLYNIDASLNEDISYSVAPNTITLGLNTPEKYKIAIKLFNTLPCPICVDDIQVLMCPVYSTKPVKYYNDSVLSSIPASEVVIQVKAYTEVIGEENVKSFELADTSDEITLSELSGVNVSHQYIAGEADSNGYDSQFGSLGVYYNDADKRLNPTTVSFDNLIVQAYSSCYFIFEVVSSTNASGGFAVSATEDMRAINFRSYKSSGVMKRRDNKWEPTSIHLRENNKWTHQTLPGYIRDTLSIRYPYNPDGTPDSEVEPEIPETPDVPTVVFDGTNWYIDNVTSNDVTMDWYGVASSSNHNSNINVITNNYQGPIFSLDVTNLSSISVTATVQSATSIDGASSTDLIMNVGNTSVRETVSINKAGTLEAGSTTKTVKLSVDTSDMSGVQTISIKIGNYWGTGANIANYSYNCTGNATVLKIETD